jgi:L-2-hydroxyglutarate oxidase LhgO
MPADKTTADPGLPRDRPTEAYWQCPPHAIASHQSPKLASEASVVIIGSGITGASVAHHLLKTCPTLDIVMLEARTICSGATGRNGGHCKDVSFKTYSKLKAQIGRQAAMQLVKFRRSHVDATRQLAHQLSEEGFGDGQFRDVTSLTAVFDQDIFRDFKCNLEALLEDFPEERGRYSVLDGEEAQKVRFGLFNAVIVSVLALMHGTEIRFHRSIRRHSLASGSPLALPTHNWCAPTLTQ